MATYQELKSQAEALMRQAEEMRKKEQAGVIADIKAKMAEYNISIYDLGADRVITMAAPRAGRKTRSDAGAPLPPKYKDSAGNTWSGRGITPKWLKKHLDSGKKLADFAV